MVKTRLVRFGGWKKIFEATLEESDANALSQPLVLRWFNLHYVQKMIATGQRLVVFGKPRLRGKRLCMEHPEFEVIENDDEISVHFRRITPIYPATEGLPQRVFRGLIYRVLENLALDSVPTLLPKNVNLGTREHALHEIHFPTTEAQREAAREHLVFSEFFAMQMLIASRRSAAALRSGQAHCGPGELLEKFLRGLPFDLTDAQVRVIDELRRDLASQAADEPLAARRCWFRQDGGRDRRDAARRGSRLSSRAHGADANPGRAALRRPVPLARTAGRAIGLADRRAAGRERAVAVV